MGVARETEKTAESEEKEKLLEAKEGSERTSSTKTKTPSAKEKRTPSEKETPASGDATQVKQQRRRQGQNCFERGGASKGHWSSYRTCLYEIVAFMSDKCK